MAGRRSRLSIAVAVLDENVGDIEVALQDGLQPHDLPVILEAIAGLRTGLVEVEDVELDIEAARRSLNVGRKLVFDERLRARDNAHARLSQALSAHKKASNQLHLVDAFEKAA